MRAVIKSYIADAATAEPLEFDRGRLQWLVGGETHPEAEMTVGVCTIEPGGRNTEHFHPNCEEILFVLEDECDHTLGDEVVHLTPRMMIRCPADLPHYAVNTGDVPMRALVCFSAPDRETRHVDQEA